MGSSGFDDGALGSKYSDSSTSIVNLFVNHPFISESLPSWPGWFLRPSAAKAAPNDSITGSAILPAAANQAQAV